MQQSEMRYGVISQLRASLQKRDESFALRLREMAASNVRKKMIKDDVGIPADMITALIT